MDFNISSAYKVYGASEGRNYQLGNEIEIVHRGKVTSSPRTIQLYVSGLPSSRRLEVGRPTRFDEVVVAVAGSGVSMPAAGMAAPDITRGQAGAALRALKARWLPPWRLDAAYVDTRAVEPNNIAHLMCNIIPTMLFAKSTVGEAVGVFRLLRAPFRDLLEQFDIPVVITDLAIEGRAVGVTATRSLQVYDILTIFDCPSLSILPDPFTGYQFARGSEPERIFLARRGARALANQSDAEVLLRRRGYETLYMEDYTVSEQLALAQGAKHVVAVHGAAMGYLVVNRGLQSVVEMFPRNVYHEFFPGLLPWARDYAVLVSGFDERVPHMGFSEILKYKSQPFAVDMDQLEAAVPV